MRGNALLDDVVAAGAGVHINWLYSSGLDYLSALKL